MGTINCHFVTRSLTAPWELKNRRLKYFDFPLKQLGEDDSLTLFAQDGLNSEEIEGLLNKLVEQPICKFKQDLEKKEDAVSIKHWRTYRALYLYFLIQAPRFAKLTEKDAKAEKVPVLDEFLLKGESYLDQMIQAQHADYDLRMFHLPDGNVLCFPATGYFTFRVQDAGCATGFTYGFGLPLYPYLAVTMVPKTATEDGLKAVRAQLHAFSVGLTDRCPRVVLPREMVEQLSEPEIIEMLTNLREASTQVMEATSKIRDLVAQAYETIGLKLIPKRSPSKTE